MRLLALFVLFASTAWADIPSKFHGSYSGFESKAVYRGAAPDQAEIQIEINKTGIVMTSAEDEAGRRWLQHFPQEWIHPLEPHLGSQCFDLKRLHWDESKLRLCFNTFLVTQGLPNMTLASGNQMNDPVAQLYRHGRILGGQPFRKLRELFTQIKNRGTGHAAPAQPLNLELLQSLWEHGDLEKKQKVLRIALRKIDLRKGADQIAALDFVRQGLSSGIPLLQKQVLNKLFESPRVSQAAEILSDFLKSAQNLDHEVLDRAVIAAIAVAGEARAITEARAHMNSEYGSEALDDIFALRLGVIDAGSVPHMMALLDFDGQVWSADQRVVLLTTLYRLSNDPFLPQKIRSDAGRAYVTDLSRSQPYIEKLCAKVLHGTKTRIDEAQSTSGSDSIIERAQ